MMTPQIRKAILEEREACAKELEDAADALELLHPNEDTKVETRLLRSQAHGLRARSRFVPLVWGK